MSSRMSSRSATRALTAPDGTVLPSATQQAASLATVCDLFGTVARDVDEIVAVTA